MANFVSAQMSGTYLNVVHGITNSRVIVGKDACGNNLTAAHLRHLRAIDICCPSRAGFFMVSCLALRGNRDWYRYAHIADCILRSTG